MNAMQKGTVKYLFTGLAQIAVIVGVSWGFAIAVTSTYEPTPHAVEVTCTACGCTSTPVKSFNVAGNAL